MLRAAIGAAHTDTDGHLRAEADERPDEPVPPVKTAELVREYRAVVEEILELPGDDGRISSFLRAIVEPGALADTCAYAPDLSFEERVRLLETVDVVERITLAVELQRERLTELQVREKVRNDVESEAHKQQREYVLRKQLESIRKELGDDEGSVIDEYREKIGESSPESQVIRTYLDWLLAVPWGERSEERLDPTHAREVLDADHAGLEDAKDRITEYIAVRKLRKDRGVADDKRSGAILTFIGPPGVGKTSIGESIARALGREFV